MNVAHINPFLEAFSYVSGQFGIESKVGRPFLKAGQKLEHQVVVMVGITGMLKGQALFNMRKDVALKIAARMIGEPEEPELNDFSRSALLELTNMVLGNAATKLAETGIKTDITPPSLMTGENMTYSLKEQTICIPIELSSGGQVDFEISVKENV